MFHHLPYAEAYRRGQVQADILDELLDADVTALDQVDFDTAAERIAEKLTPLPDR